MAQHTRAVTSAEALEANVVRMPEGTDLVEWYFEQGWTDGLPVVPPTRDRVDEFVAALGGERPAYDAQLERAFAYGYLSYIGQYRPALERALAQLES